MVSSVSTATRCGTMSPTYRPVIGNSAIVGPSPGSAGSARAAGAGGRRRWLRVVGGPAVVVDVLAHHLGGQAHPLQGSAEVHRLDLTGEEPVNHRLDAGVPRRVLVE